MAAAEAFGEALFELLVLRPGGDPAGTQDLLHGGDFVLADAWPGEWQKVQ